MAASLEGVRLCMMSSAVQAAAMQALTSILREQQKNQKEISTAVIQLTQHLQQQSCQHVHECNIEPRRADLDAYHRDVAAILKNQQILLAAVLPLRPSQVEATGISWDPERRGWQPKDKNTRTEHRAEKRSTRIRSRLRKRRDAGSAAEKRRRRKRDRKTDARSRRNDAQHR
ncbi:hypothetical protein NDU88_006539 [Pleurodeles waltl]|uniref:Uncharacterized protein n=1 Tax=Pleurodeles waltl TaxID=8319 RepID=A0AAV7PJ45_PLEWA|nr:hypothetical protein NDU88_006539 [Pleurodeles waltl]